LVLRFLLLVFLYLACLTGSARAGEKYALLVGVRNYCEAEELNPLNYPEQDVTEFAAVLQAGGWNKDHVVLMTHSEGVKNVRYLPLKERIRREMHLLLKGLQPDDTILVGFAGHGVHFEDEASGYFCPMDAQLDRRETLLSFQEVCTALEKCPAQ